MKKLILILLIVMSASLIAGTPQSTVLSSTSETLGAGVSDTLTITNVSLSGDSIGIIVELTQDSLSGSVLYQYTTSLGYTDTTQFVNLPVLVTIPINGKGTFSAGIPRQAGAMTCRIYVIITNNKSAIQTFTRNIYSILWR